MEKSGVGKKVASKKLDLTLSGVLGFRVNVYFLILYL